MKRIFTLVLALAGTLVAMAQTPEEIISRMEAAMKGYEEKGVVMTADIKIPIVGTLSMKNSSLGDKSYSEGRMLGREVRIWDDKTTTWTYDSSDNTLTIENKTTGKERSTEADADLFSGITDGYDVSIRKQTATEWHLLCRKSRSNTDKDAPRTMNLVVAKDTYYPVSLSASMSGVTLTMHDLSFGVEPETVTFNPSDFPDAKVIDKR
ncbi:MAG: hypothetical protein IJK55_00315 [Bacteroidales bacterium]|nr:hypothetical protein [Bacteroidales bacterium]